MIWSIVPITIVLWCIGGQCWKPARRYFIPIIASLYALFLKDRGKRWLCPILLLLSFILSLGYGENSELRKALGGSDFWTRIVMSVLVVSIPTTYCILTYNVHYNVPCMVIMNIAAWQVHAGSLFKIGKYDVLIEDIARATALGVSIVIM